MNTTTITTSGNLAITSYHNATGKIEYRFTNDYMFHILLQKHRKVLRGLICSLLHLQSEDVKSIIITNPIEPGADIDSKEFVLDIAIILNDDTLLNLEMQVNRVPGWNDRFLGYLCRSFDQLSKGDNYDMVKPVIHIGFLDFQPFKDNLEFYSTYKLLNVKNKHLYTSNFSLSVLDLTHIELATEEDKAYHIDHWARLFKATTWEEIKMIAEKNEYMDEAAQALYEMNADERIRQRCCAREDYYRTQRTYENALARALAERDDAIEKQNEACNQRDDAYTQRDNAFNQRDDALKLLRQQQEENARLRALLEQREVR